MVKLVEIKLKRKYTIGGKGQLGYKPKADSGDNFNHRANYHKASDAQKKIINASQPKMVMILDKNLHRRMIRVG